MGKLSHLANKTTVYSGSVLVGSSLQDYRHDLLQLAIDYVDYINFPLTDDTNSSVNKTRPRVSPRSLRLWLESVRLDSSSLLLEASCLLGRSSFCYINFVLITPPTSPRHRFVACGMPHTSRASGTGFLFIVSSSQMISKAVRRHVFLASTY